jgi:cardiolipin synthase
LFWEDNDMKTKYTLFTEVTSFYTDLLTALSQARHDISLMYFTFDHGQWSDKIGCVLRAKVARGVKVRLMVDQVGLVADTPRNAFRNQTLIKELRSAGIRVDIFRPHGPRLSRFNRLHCKVCAIDQKIAFIGGSNIGDHYPTMRDTNLRLDGDLGATFHRLYDYICQFSSGSTTEFSGDNTVNGTRLLNLQQPEDIQVLFTLPGRRQDVRRALVKLILEADQEIYICTWYFLPDREILNALLSQAENGVRVHIILSHRTRIPLVDAANYIAGHKLTKAGAQIHRYTGRYMHSKVAWNNRGDLVVGSANIDEKALSSNFECCLQINDEALIGDLKRAFEIDRRHCRLQTRKTLRSRSISRQAIAYACSYAGVWL